MAEEIIVRVEGGLLGTTGNAAGGVAGGLSVGSLAKGVALGNILLSVISKSLDKIVRANPAFYASINLLGKTMDILLRPIGDVMLLFIKPLAIGLIRFAIPLYKKWSAWLDENSAWLKEVLQSPISPVGAFTGGIDAITDIVDAINTRSLDPFADEANSRSELVKSLLSSTWEGITEFWGTTFPELISYTWDGITEFWGTTFPELLSEAWEGFTTFWGTTVPELLSVTWEGITKFWGETLPLILTATWGIFTKFFTSTLPTVLQTTWDKIINFFSVTLPTEFDNLISGTIKLLFDLWDVASQLWSIDIPSVFKSAVDTLIGFFNVDITDSFTNFKNYITEFFTVGIIDSLKSFVTFFTKTVPSWMDKGGTLYDKVKEFFTKTLPNKLSEGLNSLFSTIEEWVTKIKMLLGLSTKNKGKAVGGFIDQTGVYQLHAGEYVMRAGDVSAGKASVSSPTFNTNVTVNGNISSRQDITDLANEINKKIMDQLKRDLQYRTTYARGF